ncbi:respiratory nitrate reductase subunit gamma [Desulfurispirillum indicum]|uniref:respiratory nitrate reductase subunit gamma n=1 Tax=Desulfurispirillum indicum TaxID=936456 RepID=UPI001CFBD259|nr:respiratory nitrate reductase subunit gamma [Desulfurispirillum indicum]UCZ56478.1 respiratory nitrate reductase subunit gamma [Desulfurispirillum indicum]
MPDLFFFAIFPYVAVVLAIGATWYRYSRDRYSHSSHSSQFLESPMLYWGSVPWHIAIFLVLAAHLLAFLFPAAWATLAGRPLRLYLLEVTGLALGITTVIGIALLMVRRFTRPRVKVVTTTMDWVLLLLLLLQVISGVVIAVTLRWGSVWYLHTATPWLWSLFSLSPQVEYMANLPWIVKFHAVNAFVLIAVLPFTRLVHVLSVPLGYLWRPAQVVIWNRRRTTGNN